MMTGTSVTKFSFNTLETYIEFLKKNSGIGKQFRDVTHGINTAIETMINKIDPDYLHDNSSNSIPAENQEEPEIIIGSTHPIAIED